MDFSANSFTCASARDIDIVSYLGGLGISPARIRGRNFWYLSPFRDERTPSFKVDRVRNRYYDFGEARGGNFIDLAVRLEDCTVGELLRRLTADLRPVASLPATAAVPHGATGRESTIRVLGHSALSSSALLDYLYRRRIPVRIADSYLREIRYTVHGKNYYAIGFRNDSGGWELRNPYFKGSSAPKDVSSFSGGRKVLSVFEGFMDFLSFLVLTPEAARRSDFIVLNSLPLLERARQLMKGYPAVDLYLDNDEPGRNHTALALGMDASCRDGADLYKGYKDLNDYLCRLRADAPP